MVCSAPKITLTTDSAYCNLHFQTATKIKVCNVNILEHQTLTILTQHID